MSPLRPRGVVLLVTTTLAACDRPPAPRGSVPTMAASRDAPVVDPEVVRGPGYEGVILPPSLADLWPAGPRPTPGEIAVLESRLVPFLQGALARGVPNAKPGLVPRLATYKRQYLGVRNNHRAAVWVNLLCRWTYDYWQRELVRVLDGGDCYLQVYYDPATGQFSSLAVNPES